MQTGPLTFGTLTALLFSSFMYMREAGIGQQTANLESVTKRVEEEVYEFDQRGITRSYTKDDSPVLNILQKEKIEEPGRFGALTTFIVVILAIKVVFFSLRYLGVFEKHDHKPVHGVTPHPVPSKPSLRKLAIAIASIGAAVIVAVELYGYVFTIPPGTEPVLQATTFEGSCRDITCPAYKYDTDGFFTAFALIMMNAATSFVTYRSIMCEQKDHQYNWWVLFWQVTTASTVFALVNAWALFDSSYMFIFVGSAHLVFGDLQLALRVLTRVREVSAEKLEDVPETAPNTTRFFGSRAPRSATSMDEGRSRDKAMAVEAATKDETIFKFLVVVYLFMAILLGSSYPFWQLFLIIQKANFVVHALVMFIYLCAMVLMLRGASAPSEFWWQFFAHVVHMAGEWIPSLVEQVQKAFPNASGSEDGTSALDTRILLGIAVVIQGCVCLKLYTSDNFVKMEFLRKFARFMTNKLANLLHRYQWLPLSRRFWVVCLIGQVNTFYLTATQQAPQNIKKPFTQRNVAYGQYHSVSDGITVAVFVYLQVTFPIMIDLIQRLHYRTQNLISGNWNEVHFMLWSFTSAVTVAFFVYRPALDSPIWWVDSIIHLLLDLRIAYTCVASLKPIWRNFLVVIFLILVVALSIPVASSSLSGANAVFTGTHVTKIFLDLNAVWHLIVTLALICNPTPTLSAQPSREERQTHTFAAGSLSAGPVQATGNKWAVMENWAIFFHLSPVILAKVPIIGWNANSTDECLSYACYGRLVVLVASALTLFCTFQLQSSRP